MPYDLDYEHRIQAAFIGAGDHAYRNILPCFQYLPIEIVAMADEDRERGLAVARRFGVRRFYPNHKALFAKEKKLDVAIIVLGPGEDGFPQYSDIGCAALRAGLHTWIDAPPCARSQDIFVYTDACMSQGKYIMCGFKRMFAPIYERVAEIVAEPAFGGLSSYYMRYPVKLPSADELKNDAAKAAFLEFVHPYSLLMRLFGEAQQVSFSRSTSDDAIITLRYTKGHVGVLHLTGSQAATGPLERLEIIGSGANLVVDNGSRLTYYRSGGRRGDGPLSDLTNYVGPHDRAPIIWEPEFSLGNLYNKQLFMEGYVGALEYFAQQVLLKQPFRTGNIVDILHIMSVYEKIASGRENTWISV